MFTLLNTLLLSAALIAIAILLYFRKKKKHKELGIIDLQNTPDNILEPLISYSVFTVDENTHLRFLNYYSEEFPHHYGILNKQYIELDWNVINADWISIEGVGFVQAVGKMAFYPTENIIYRIHAKNMHHEITQEIFVRIFPVNIKEELFQKIPEIKIKTELLVPEIIVTRNYKF